MSYGIHLILKLIMEATCTFDLLYITTMTWR
jgi:hypothetical protein